ncbi:MAG: glycosyltransferase family 2 protein [Flavobacteriaceae bacterium]|nr:glycosyltransferase family 2 protein [Flavobacteriaceae bacterium]
MKVSIITISYNSVNTIQGTLESVLNQTYKNIEHIVIDGNSNDNTVSICKNYSHLFKIISEKDKGVYDAFNKGLKIASGDIVGFLNSDDIFYNIDSLKTIVDEFDTNTDAVFGNLKFYNKKNKVIRKWISKPYKKGAFERAWMPPHPTFYCRKSIYNELGFYNDSFKIAGDFELMLRFIELNNIKTKFINKNLIKMKAGGISNSGLISKIKILEEEFKAFKINKISLNKFFYIINKGFKIKEFL